MATRRAFWGLTWLLATSASVVLAWLGVRVVASEVTDNRSSPLTERAVTREATATGPPEAADPALGSPPSRPEPADASPDRPAAAPPSAPRSAGGDSRTGPPVRRSGPAPVTAPGERGAPPTTVPPPPDASTETISSKGGTVAVRYEPGSAELVWAKPNAGFTMDVQAQGPQKVDVRFNRGRHQSRVEAWWEDGPRHSTREDKE